MKLDHVFAKGTVSLIGPAGVPVGVQGGSCWLADDALVKAHPEAFSEDCRYALGRDQSWSGEPPAVMSVPPDDEPVQRGYRRSPARAAAR